MLYYPIDKMKNDDPRLPEKSLFRIDEVAEYFQVTSWTVRNWIKLGFLKGERVVGSIRVSREAILECRKEANDQDKH